MTNINDSQSCDLTIEQAVAQMMQRTGDMELVIDRMLTFGAAQACVNYGPEKDASMLSYLMAHIQHGTFAYLGQPDDQQSEGNDQ